MCSDPGWCPSTRAVAGGDAASGVVCGTGGLWCQSTSLLLRGCVNHAQMCGLVLKGNRKSYIWFLNFFSILSQGKVRQNQEKIAR